MGQDGVIEVPKVVIGVPRGVIVWHSEYRVKITQVAPKKKFSMFWRSGRIVL